MPSVGALMTTRAMMSPASQEVRALGEGSRRPVWPSATPYDDFNLGDHVGDDPDAVARHRAALAEALGAHPVWLHQVHGHHVPRVTQADARASLTQPVTADGSWTTEPGVACTVMVADCLPVLLAAPGGRGVAALHAGWRGLSGAGGGMAGRGVLEVGVAQLCQGAGCDPQDLQAWLGPCIGPGAFEVGADVLQGFGVDPAQAHPRFTPLPYGAGAAADGQAAPPKWWGDLAGLAADRLRALGLTSISGGDWCTASDASRFFSFRRDGVTGRQAACIWIRP
ncbi:MAG: peptidoglycan editing factor PgeF [Rubrivivax sp.]|nr:MAG: peptidoglycan editing factor PgeF [Rubrivivax sp.]